MILSDYSNLKTFVINLDNHIDKYNKQILYLTDIGLSPNRFSAINALQDEHLKPEYIKYIPYYVKCFTPKSIIGCSLSHIMLCKYIYDNYIKVDNINTDQYYLILEDDCFPKYSRQDFYNNLIKNINEIEILDKNWEIIQLHSDALLPTRQT